MIDLRNLLKEDGAIFIQVDDKEQAYLKVLCDEIFSRDNFIATFIWEARSGQGNTVKHIAESHEYILFYAKNHTKINVKKQKRIQNEGKYYDKIGSYNREQLRQWGQGDRREDRPSMFFPITAPDGSMIYPIRNDGSEGRWRYGKNAVENLVQNNEIDFVKDENGIWNCYKKIRSGKINYYAFTTFIKDIGTASSGTRELKSIFIEKVFDTPKPESLIHTIYDLITIENDLILDCFCGSGSTLAVAHKMKCRWIGIEIGFHCDSVIIPRLKKVLTGEDQGGISKAVNWKGGGSFKYFHVGHSIIHVDKTTGKGEFNWSLDKQFIQESLLISYDFVSDSTFTFKNTLFGSDTDKPAVGYIANSRGERMCGVAWLVAPGESHISISSEEFHALYRTLKAAGNVKSVTIFTNKGVDVKEDTVGDDVEIIKVPHAIFAELER